MRVKERLFLFFKEKNVAEFYEFFNQQADSAAADVQRPALELSSVFPL